MGTSNKKQRHVLTGRVVVHEATPEQECRITEAIDLFLAEWVRRHLAQREEMHVQQQGEAARPTSHSPEAVQ